MIEVGTILLPSHEATSHGFVPSSLRFVENDNPIAGRCGITQTVITKVVNVLNKGFHLLAHFALTDFFLDRLQALDFVTGQCLTQNCNEGAIPRKEDCMGLLMFLAFLGSDIKANECFSCTRNTRYKDDVLFAVTGGLFD